MGKRVNKNTIFATPLRKKKRKREKSALIVLAEGQFLSFSFLNRSIGTNSKDLCVEM